MDSPYLCESSFPSISNENQSAMLTYLAYYPGKPLPRIINLSYPRVSIVPMVLKGKPGFTGGKVAGPTRLELATSGVTGQRSNQTELRPHLGVSYYSIKT